MPSRFLRTTRAVDDDCVRWRENAYAWIEDEQPDLLLLASRIQTDETTDVVADWLAGAERLGAVAPLVFITDVPAAEIHVPACAARALWRGKEPNEACSFVATAEQVTLQRALRDASSERLRWLDLYDSACMESPCPVLSEVGPTYRDEHHLHSSFSATLTSAVVEAFDGHRTPH